MKINRFEHDFTKDKKILELSQTSSNDSNIEQAKYIKVVNKLDRLENSIFYLDKTVTLMEKF